jgi:hypothetical protein
MVENYKIKRWSGLQSNQRRVVCITPRCKELENMNILTCESTSHLHAKTLRVKLGICMDVFLAGSPNINYKDNSKFVICTY